MYWLPAALFVDGGVLYSNEGTTQGDSLAVSFYALAIPLFSKGCPIKALFKLGMLMMLPPTGNLLIFTVMVKSGLSAGASVWLFTQCRENLACCEGTVFRSC